MIPIYDDERIFLHGTPVDLRNGFDGLSFIAQSIFKKQMLPKTHFVFFNPRRTRMKVLYWNGDNLVIWYLRLRKGVFFPPGCLISVQISKSDFEMIMNKRPPQHLLCLQNNS